MVVVVLALPGKDIVGDKLHKKTVVWVIVAPFPLELHANKSFEERFSESLVKFANLFDDNSPYATRQKKALFKK
jgi:hypothetical protein